MPSFLATLHERNSLLYQFGWLCFAGTLVCAVLVASTQTQVLGINAFIKPLKFFVSTGIVCWTMGLFTGLLPQQRSVTVYSWVTVAVFTFELVIIVWQASRGKLSHFNSSSPTDLTLFRLMGMAIAVFTLWTAYIGYLFFKLDTTSVSPAYLWGIRLGIILFVIFAFEGFLMGSRLAHTVGAPDGGPGLPVLNWSTRHGDLRVAHFFGMHALQLLPLFGYFLARHPRQVILAAALYFVLVTTLLLRASAGKPFF